MNTHVGRIAQQQVILGSFAMSLSLSPQALEDEIDDGSSSDDADKDNGASSSVNNETATSQLLTLCHS